MVGPLKEKNPAPPSRCTRAVSGQKQCPVKLTIHAHSLQLCRHQIKHRGRRRLDEQPATLTKGSRRPLTKKGAGKPYRSEDEQGRLPPRLHGGHVRFRSQEPKVPGLAMLGQLMGQAHLALLHQQRLAFESPDGGLNIITPLRFRDGGPSYWLVIRPTTTGLDVTSASLIQPVQATECPTTVQENGFSASRLVRFRPRDEQDLPRRENAGLRSLGCAPRGSQPPLTSQSPA